MTHFSIEKTSAMETTSEDRFTGINVSYSLWLLSEVPNSPYPRGTFKDVCCHFGQNPSFVQFDTIYVRA